MNSYENMNEQELMIAITAIWDTCRALRELSNDGELNEDSLSRYAWKISCKIIRDFKNRSVEKPEQQSKQNQEH